MTGHTENKRVEAIMQKGSMKLDLHRMAIDTAEFAKSVPMDIKVRWIQRVENELADKLSKTDDWDVSRDFFKFIIGKSGSLGEEIWSSLQPYWMSGVPLVFGSVCVLINECFLFQEGVWRIPDRKSVG